jgi:hypothetical protein
VEETQNDQMRLNYEAEEEHHRQQDVNIISYYESLHKRPWHQGGIQASLQNADFFKKTKGRSPVQPRICMLSGGLCSCVILKIGVSIHARVQTIFATKVADVAARFRKIEKLWIGPFGLPSRSKRGGLPPVIRGIPHGVNRTHFLDVILGFRHTEIVGTGRLSFRELLLVGAHECGSLESLSAWWTQVRNSIF